MASIVGDRELSKDRDGPVRLAGQEVWHHSAPKKVLMLCRPGRSGEGWEAWVSHLAKRSKPRPIHRLIRSATWPLSWNLPDGKSAVHAGGDTTLIGELGKLAQSESADASTWRQRVRHWAGKSTDAPDQAIYALECVSIAHALPRLAAVLDAPLWWDVVERLLLTARDAASTDLATGPLANQLLAGELPLSLAHGFPEISACRPLRVAAYQALSHGLVELLDGEGVIEETYLDSLGALVACWTRSRVIGKQGRGGCWSADAELQYQWLVTQVLRFMRFDGSLMFSQDTAGPWCMDLLATALSLTGDSADRTAAQLSLPRLPGKRAVSSGSSDEVPEPSTNSEWARLSVMRPEWTRTGLRLGVRYRDVWLGLEFSAGRDRLLSGCWEYQVHCDEHPLRPVGTWEESCWESDEEGDYLELELELEGGASLQRQIFLARTDRILILADVVVNAPGRQLRYHGCLPLGSAISVRPAEETRELWLAGSQDRALVMPLALPEWRCGAAQGSCRQAGGNLEWSGFGPGRNLYCSLFFDLDSRRMTKQCTWRQLTVAENRQILPQEAAVGYRVQCGSDQWVIYRSLAARASRTLLGQNVTSEFLVGRFSREGIAEPLIEIE